MKFLRVTLSLWSCLRKKRLLPDRLIYAILDFLLILTADLFT